MRLEMHRALFLLALLSGGCGASALPEEEETATWSSGDDEPLEGPDSGGSEEEAEGSAGSDSGGTAE